MATHVLNRTSPKGEKFSGTCSLCGARDLPSSAALDECPNPRGLSQDAAVCEALDAVDHSAGWPG